jgi:ABC-type dipeptide/oligopeptide/nickel transport system permease subunit
MKIDTSKSTILVISMGFLVLHLLFSWQWAVLISLLVGVIGITSPYLSGKIESIWMKFAKILGYIIPNVLLSIVYYLFLFPISALSKLFNKDPLMLSRIFFLFY